MPARPRNRKGRYVPHRRGKRKLNRARCNPHRQTVVKIAGSRFVPDKTLVKLHYSDNRSINTADADYVEYVYRMNGLFDPDQTGTGHQPMGYDQWAAMYKRYKVYASKITVSGINTSSAAVNSGIIGIYPSDVSGTLIGPTTSLVESRNCKHKFSEGQHTVYVSNYSNPMKITGLDKTEEDLSAETTTNPDNQAFWHVAFGNLSGAQNNNALLYSVDITYYCEFSQPRKQTQS